MGYDFSEVIYLSFITPEVRISMCHFMLQGFQKHHWFWVIYLNSVMTSNCPSLLYWCLYIGFLDQGSQKHRFGTKASQKSLFYHNALSEVRISNYLLFLYMCSVCILFFQGCREIFTSQMPLGSLYDLWEFRLRGPLCYLSYLYLWSKNCNKTFINVIEMAFERS